MTLTIDLNDRNDVRTAVEYLTAHLATMSPPVPQGGLSPGAGPAPAPVAEPTAAPQGYDRRAVRRTLAGYGSVRLPIVCAIAKASPGRLSKAAAHELAHQARPGLNPAKVMAGLHSSLERGWRGRTGRIDKFVTTYRDGYFMDPDLAQLVLELVDELLPTMKPHVASAVRRVLDEQTG